MLQLGDLVMLGQVRGPQPAALLLQLIYLLLHMISFLLHHTLSALLFTLMIGSLMQSNACDLLLYA